jgi:chromosome segregation ATPase
MPLTPSQRQAQRRAKALEEGRKNLAIAAVNILHHEAIKEAVKRLETGEAVLGSDNSIIKPIRDKKVEMELETDLKNAQTHIEKLNLDVAKITRSYHVQKSNTASANLRVEQLVKENTETSQNIKSLQSELKKIKTEIGEFKSLIWRFYFKKKQ